MSELLGVDELPDRAVVDLEAALGELSHEPAQGEVPLPAAPDQPVAMRAGDLLRLVTADLARRDAAGGCDPLQPVPGWNGRKVLATAFEKLCERGVIGWHLSLGA